MDLYHLEKLYRKTNSSLCCESVANLKQCADILHVEINRLSSMQVKCNKLLDNYCIIKNYFDWLINEILPIKYFAKDDSFPAEEYISEFTIFSQSIWQMGKQKFSERGKKAKYMSLTGYPLSEVIYNIQTFVDEVLHYMTHTSTHVECMSFLNSLSFQIKVDLHEGSLGSADACFLQLTYLELAIPFIHKLCWFVHQYVLLPDVHTPKQFVDSALLGIPSDERLLLKDGLEDMLPYRFLIDLLNGKLLESEILDHNSDIRPVVEYDSNLKRCNVIMVAVDWILQQYFYVQKSNPSLILNGDFERYIDFYRGMNHFRNSLKNSIPKPTLCRANSRKFSRVSESSSLNDLQPIKLHNLQMPLLPPLL